MGFLDTVVIPGEEKKKKSGFRSSSFLSSVRLPGDTRGIDKTAALRVQAEQSKRAADTANSFQGLLSETFRGSTKGLVEGFKSVETKPRSFKNLYENPYLPLEEGSKVLFQTLDDSAKRLQNWGKVSNDPKASTA